MSVLPHPTVDHNNLAVLPRPVVDHNDVVVLPRPTVDHNDHNDHNDMMQSWEKDLLYSMMRSNNRNVSWQATEVEKHHYEKHSYEDEQSDSGEDSGFQSRPISAEMMFSKNAKSSNHYLLSSRQRIQANSKKILEIF